MRREDENKKGEAMRNKRGRNMITQFICEIKSRFVFCKNVNLNVYCETRFDDLIF